MMTSFREEEWESAGNIVLELGNCPPENKKLRCWLRPRAGEPLSQASLSRVAHSLQPGRERITDWLSQVAPGFGPITTDPAIRVNPHNSNLDPRQAYSPFFKPKTCSSVIESAQSALQQDMIPEIQNPRPATSNQHDWGYDDFLPDWGQGVGAQFQYPLFHQERQYQQPQQGQLAQTNEPSQPRQQIPPTSEPLQFLLPQQTDNQAVSSPPKPPAPYPIIIVNFLANGVRPFDIDGGYCSGFQYLSYFDISTAVTVSYLMKKLRLQNAGMKGITVMLVRGQGFWGAGMTILEDSEMAEKTLAELGWGWEWDTVWLAVEM
ncbi:MAG: hypothetical protein ASARMPRED_002735 [Alectoria sarmentosa]|nr:MAG: hypothetical protein ASARMPRED_002735 [Alectoria sarmentosa]